MYYYQHDFKNILLLLKQRKIPVTTISRAMNVTITNKTGGSAILIIVSSISAAVAKLALYTIFIILIMVYLSLSHLVCHLL